MKTPESRVYRIALLATMVLAGCRGPTYPRSGRGPCALEPRGDIRADARRCFAAQNARAQGVALGPDGTAAIAGTFSGTLADGPFRVFSDEVQAGGHSVIDRDGRFLMVLQPTLDPKLVLKLDIPGWLRGLRFDGHRVTLVSDAAPPAVGPFLTGFDASGHVVSRSNSSLGGIATSTLWDGAALWVRHQADGLRAVRLKATGEVVAASPPLAPPWVHQFPLAIDDNAIISQMAKLRDGSVVVFHARELTYVPGESGEALSRVAPDGKMLWQVPISLGRNVQLAPLEEGVLALSPEPAAICRALRPMSAFALTLVDSRGAVVWRRCYASTTSGLRLATHGTEALVGGQFTGSIRLDAAVFDTQPGQLQSFVMWVGPDGHTLSAGTFGDSNTLVVVQALALGPNGRAVVAGASGLGRTTQYGWDVRQTHLFAAVVNR